MTAVWNVGTSPGPYTVKSASRAPGGAWTDAATVSTGSTFFPLPEVAVDPAGDATVVWRLHGGAVPVVLQASTKAAGATSWPPGEDLDVPTTSSADVAAGPDGTFVAVWSAVSGGVPRHPGAGPCAGGRVGTRQDLELPGSRAGQRRRDRGGPQRALHGGLAAGEHAQHLRRAVLGSRSRRLLVPGGRPVGRQPVRSHTERGHGLCGKCHGGLAPLRRHQLRGAGRAATRGRRLESCHRPLRRDGERRLGRRRDGRFRRGQVSCGRGSTSRSGRCAPRAGQPGGSRTPAAGVRGHGERDQPRPGGRPGRQRRRRLAGQRRARDRDRHRSGPRRRRPDDHGLHGRPDRPGRLIPHLRRHRRRHVVRGGVVRLVLRGRDPATGPASPTPTRPSALTR